MAFMIMKRPSRGRGEYELSGSAGGLSPSDLENHQLAWDTPFGVKLSSVVLRLQGGKYRFRMAGGVRGTHVHSQVAALAMLPPPIRDESLLAHDGPVLMQNRFVLDVAVDVGNVDAGTAILKPRVVIARSGPPDDLPHQVRLGMGDRYDTMMAVWRRVEHLPPALRAAVEAHRAALHGPAIGLDAVRGVSAIMTALEAAGAALYIPGSDPLPALEALLGLQTDEAYPVPEEPPSAVNPEVRRRLESEYRSVKSRGRSGRLFKQAVQAAYGYTCVFCGFRALDIPGLARSGVDAAHILPWGQFDLDVVTNGLQLCKIDHWLFDVHVLLLRHNNGIYFVEVNPRFEDLIEDKSTLEKLVLSVGVIPEERLPVAHERPNPEYLKRLYEGLDEA